MTRKRVAILISGGGSNMAALIRDMAIDHPGEPCLVLSNSPKAEGLKRAADMGIPTAVVDHRTFGKDRQAFDTAMQKVLENARPDLICLAGFMRILTDPFVTFWQGRMINIHPSILPLFPGLETHRRCLEAGMSVHGCTVHHVTPTLDSGPILGQAVVPVAPDDSPETLAARVLNVEHRLYPAVLRRVLNGDSRPVAILDQDQPTSSRPEKK